MGKFPLVRKWFLDTFKNFNMEEAKDQITAAQIAKINAVSAVSKCEVVDMPKAV